MFELTRLRSAQPSASAAQRPASPSCRALIRTAGVPTPDSLTLACNGNQG